MFSRTFGIDLDKPDFNYAFGQPLRASEIVNKHQQNMIYSNSTIFLDMLDPGLLGIWAMFMKFVQNVQ